MVIRGLWIRAGIRCGNACGLFVHVHHIPTVRGVSLLLCALGTRQNSALARSSLLRCVDSARILLTCCAACLRVIVQIIPYDVGHVSYHHLCVPYTALLAISIALSSACEVLLCIIACKVLLVAITLQTRLLTIWIGFGLYSRWEVVLHCGVAVLKMEGLEACA